ncbi:BREX-1 system phosphatase PglZ type B [Dasania marina]|uniref:BREX-1 system phosphatase PglZ type B n=1 Tax=Dasania marina TaxID=471499 RepID=UPI00037CDD11|nr:BREX-1 system phosphatase PglZ type B [Dasania marina]
MTLIDRLVEVVRQASSFNEQTQAAPAAVLWTDKECQWQTAMPLIKQHLPELIELGDYAPEQRIGPAVWIKCAIARKVADLPLDRTPIIYLPGIARKEMRAIELCPEYLQPLAELQYRGFWWATPNTGRDWTVSGFLANKDIGLELDVAKDAKTQAALKNVLSALLNEEAASLEGQRLDADDLNRLVADDPLRDLLQWLDNPDVINDWEAVKLNIFERYCLDSFGLAATPGNRESFAQSMCEQQGEWAALWARFSDIANRLPGLLELLTAIRPKDLASDASAYLAVNQDDELALQQALLSLAGADDEQVRGSLAKLYKKHQARQEWLWAELRLSPYLDMLVALKDVALYTKSDFAGPDVETMAAAYQRQHWQADAAAISAMAAAGDDTQRKLVADVLSIIYTPWLTRVAENFQQLVQKFGYPGAPNNEVNEATGGYASGGQLLFFVDGLRFDVAQQLLVRLEAKARVVLTTHWSALPSLTATAKAALTPVQNQLTGHLDNDDFNPMLRDTQQNFGSYHLKRLLAEAGWQFLEGVETGDPTGQAWVQTGDLDHAGHDEQLRLPSRISDILDEVEARIHGLLDAGWPRIRIVTDHGWLWVPDKLPKTELPKDTTAKRFSRCAILKSNVATDRLSQPWYWNSQVRVAMAPGISGFTAGDYYNHGGLTLQECLTPVLNIQPKA